MLSRFAQRARGRTVKVAYLLRVRPDLEKIIPHDVEHGGAEVGADGRYDDEALASVADA